MPSTAANSAIIHPETATRSSAQDLITLPVFFIYLWTFIHVGRPQDVFPALKAIYPGNIAAGLSILSFLLWGEKDKRFFSFPETKLFFLFLFIALLSTPFGYHRTHSVNFLIDFFGKVGLYLFIATKLITTERRIDGLIKTIMLSGFLMAVATALSQIAGVRTAVGTTYDPNDMALLMVVTIPLALTQGLAAKRFSWKLLSYTCLAFCLVAMIATQSRGGFIGLLAVGFFVLRTKMPGLPKRKMLLLGAVFGFFFIISMGQEFSSRMSTILEDVSSRRAGSGRMLVWQRSLVLAAHHPLLGVGPRCFQSAYGRYLNEGKFKGALAPVPGEWAAYKWAVAHSAYLTVLVEFGFFGFIIYISFILRTLRNINTIDLAALNKEAQAQWGLILSGMKISYIGFLVCIVFLSTTYSPLFFLYFFISGNLLRFSNSKIIPNKSGGPQNLDSMLSSESALIERN